MENEELIEKFFEKALTPSELRDFNEKLAANQDFREAFELQRSIKKVVAVSERNTLKNQLQQFEEAKTKSKNRFRWQFAAAAVAILMISVYLLNSYSANNLEQLFEAYYEAYPNTEMPMVRNAKQNSLPVQAFAAYEKGDFATASQLFSQLTSEDYAVFYKAICEIENKNHEVALKLLQNKNFGADYKLKATWYLAMLHLKMGDVEKAKTLLSKLIRERSFKTDEALRLLKKLN